MKKILSIIYIFICTIAVAQGNDALFKQGNDLYNEGKIMDAISVYEKIIENGYHSSELYYNLGNAYYKLNKIAPSIFYYEKAIQLAPKDEEIKNNLAFANNMTIDAIETIPELGFSRLQKNATNLMSFDGWAFISVGLVILFVILFISYYFSDGTTKKRITFLSAFTALFFGMMALGLAFKKFDFDQRNKPAIVFAQESDVKTEPNLRSENAFELHEGTKVQILETYDQNWTRIRIADGKTGWIPTNDIKAL